MKFCGGGGGRETKPLHVKQLSQDRGRAWLSSGDQEHSREKHKHTSGGVNKGVPGDQCRGAHEYCIQASVQHMCVS